MRTSPLRLIILQLLNTLTVPCNRSTHRRSGFPPSLVHMASVGTVAAGSMREPYDAVRPRITYALLGYCASRVSTSRASDRKVRILRFTMSLPIATLHLTFPGGSAEAWSTITPSQALSFGAAIGAKGALGDGALG